MPIEESNAVLDGLELNRIGIVQTRVVASHIDEAVHIVFVGFPFNVFARFVLQFVTDPEDTLQFVAVAPLY